MQMWSRFFSIFVALVDLRDDVVTHLRPDTRPRDAEISVVVAGLVTVAVVASDVAEVELSAAGEKFADDLHLHHQTNQ